MEERKSVSELTVGDRLWRIHDLTQKSPESNVILSITHNDGWWTLEVDKYNYQGYPHGIAVRERALRKSRICTGGGTVWFTSKQDAFNKLIDRYEDWISEEHEGAIRHLERVEKLQGDLKNIKEAYEADLQGG